MPDQKVNVLIVNDNPSALLSLTTVLENLGERLVPALSAREALAYLLNHDVAVILLDVNMPEMDGYEAASLIRQRTRSQDTPIIFVTAMSVGDTAKAVAYRLGAVDYLFTPVSPEILRAKVSWFADLYRKTNQVKQQSAELSAANSALEQQLSEILRLNQELETANEQLEAFSYSASHDLRGPLRAIRGFSYLLQEDAGERLNKTCQEHVQQIVTGVIKMDQLIEDLLQLAKVTKAEMRTSSVDLSNLARGIAVELAQEHPERHVELDIAEGVNVRGDEALLAVALRNLLQNAFKFTSHRPEARIEFGASSESGDALGCWIRDNGAGFNSGNAERLFSPFCRLHTEADFPGTGIGLAIVQRVIRKHGGKVWAEGEVDRGATFHFTLPGA